MDASIVTKVTNKLISISEDIPILHEWLGENFTDEKILEFIKESTSPLLPKAWEVKIFGFG